MAENIPFIHTIALGVWNHMGGIDNRSVNEIIPTVMVAASMSTILNGLLFYAVGYFRLGNILKYFPQYVIIGCIGMLNICSNQKKMM